MLFNLLKSCLLCSGFYTVIILSGISPLLSIESDLDITARLNEKILIQWEPSNIAAELYPQYTEAEANYSFSTPARLTCYSNSLGGWKVIAESENTALDNTFLLVSENQEYSFRYVLVVEDQNKKSIVVKNRGTLLETSHFVSDPIQVNVYPKVLGGELSKVPAGYYTGKIKACFIDN